MPGNMNLPIEADAQSAPFGQGADCAEDLLKRLNNAMAAAAEDAQRRWPWSSSGLMQEVSQAGRAAAAQAAQVGAAPQQTAGAGGLLGQTVTQALAGMTVSLDGEAVGSLVAPTVNQLIAAAAHERRYAG